MIINDGSVKTIRDFVTTKTLINFLPLLVSEPRFYQINLIFMRHIQTFTPFLIKSIIDASWVLSFSLTRRCIKSTLFHFHSLFTLYFYFIFLLRANYFTLSWLVTPENLLQHLHSQILRRNMAQAINIVFIKTRSFFAFIKIWRSFDFPFLEGDNLSGLTFFV